MPRRCGSGGEEPECVRLGGEVIAALADVLGNPSAVESLRLYMGMGEGLLTLLIMSIPGGTETFSLDVEGNLVYRRDLPWAEEVDPVEEVVITEASDFGSLPLGSVSALHERVTLEDFWDRLAWQAGRWGKPGYLEHLYDVERETWRLRDSDEGERRGIRWRIRDAERAGKRRGL